MNNNLTTSNLNPFVSDKTLKKIKVKDKDNKIIDKNFNFKDFISNESNPLPLIPGIYFNNNDNDNIGSKIINNYYNIKICMKKISIIKTFILLILEVLGVNDLDKIIISKEKYKLLKSDLIIPFNDTLSGTFKDQDYFKKFVTLYRDQKYGIFKNFNLEVPYFFQIFQIEYNNTPKTFFISLFNKYITLRRKILTYITENFGILAFTSFFDLSDNIDFEMLKNNIRSKNGNNNDEYNENYKNYILYGNNINILSNESKVNKKKITEKIHSFDYLYVSKFDNAYYKKKHQEQIHKNYFNLNESINNFIGVDSKFDLLSIIKNNLEVDYNTINFIFNYVDPLIYGKAVDSNILIKQFISKKINNFELYYDQYMYWIKTLCKNIEGNNSKIDDDYNFGKFYNNILSKIDDGYTDPCEPASKSNDGSPAGTSSSGTNDNNLKEINAINNKAKIKNNILPKNNDNSNLKVINEDQKLPSVTNDISSHKSNGNSKNEILKEIDILAKKLFKIHIKNEIINRINKNYTKNKLNKVIKNSKEEFGNRIKNYDEITNELKEYLLMNEQEKNNYNENLMKEFNKLFQKRDSLINIGVKKGFIKLN